MKAKFYRLQLQVSQRAYSDLYIELEKAGRFYAGKRFLQLASNGLLYESRLSKGEIVPSAEKGILDAESNTDRSKVSMVQEAGIEVPQTNSIGAEHKYTIPDDASSAVGAMLSSMGID